MLAQSLLWLLSLQLISVAAFPFAYRAFSRLPDRGWAFSKPLGLLLTGLATWFIGLSHTIPNSGWTVFLALLMVAALSALASRHNLREIWEFARARAGVILATEMVFLTAFIAVAIMRASVPDISHTEQPMDFMLLNAVVVSPNYPPNDPWMAGEAVSYYYLGYLIIGAVAMLTGTATAVAYNLGLATVAALGAIAAFGLTFNLVRLARGPVESAVLGGCLAVVLLLVASNLGGVLELFRAAGGGSESFWAAVGIEGLTARPPSSSWAPDDPGWWWRISRIIPGAITEFPLFSFVLGDLHPHVMSIGFLLLSAGAATQVYLQAGLLGPNGVRRHWPLVVVVVAAAGALASLNLWDLPLGLGLLAAALMLNAARNERTLHAGASLALSDRTIAMGAPGDRDGAGSALVFRKAGGRWYPTTQVSSAAPAPGAALGTSVATDGDTMVAGAPGTSSVHVFTDEGGHWRQRAMLTPPYRHLGVESGDFGRSIVLDDGLLAVGAPDTTGCGAVYIFVGEGAQWPLQAAIRDEDTPPGARFGAALALHGNTLAVGAPGEGAVYVYDLEGVTWRRTARLTPGPMAPVTGFGRSLSLGDGHIAVGAVGATYVFQATGYGWGSERVVLPPEHGAMSSFGSAVAIQDPHLLVGARSLHGSAARSGSVFTYKREDSAWRFQTRLTADDVGADAFFGSALALRGTIAAVGAPGSGQGGIYLFNRDLDKWHALQKLASRWRFARGLFAGALLVLGALVLAVPFLATFESTATGVLPLRGLLTRPLHLLLIWGTFALVVLPLFVLTLRRLFTPGNWSPMRFGVAMSIAFAPVILWLQPVWGVLLILTVVLLFGLHQAGYRLPRVDEMSFAFNSGVTRVIGGSLLAGLLLWDGIRHERGLEGQFLAIDRLIIVTPMAVVIALAIFTAWTLAHRDSERRRVALSQREQKARNDGHTPVLLLLAFAAALVMGVELFHVTDFFGGELRRMNTVFKAYYQAWTLMAVIGGFGLWYVLAHFHIRTFSMRLATTGMAALLVVIVAAVSYYPLAAVSARTGGMDNLRLDGQAYLLLAAPADYAAVQWIRENLPRDAVVLESVVVPWPCPENPQGCSSYTEAGRISGSTGRPTVLGWENHQLQWRGNAEEISNRKLAVRTIYETEDVDTALGLLARYNVAYVVVGPRERAAYGAEGLGKFSQMGERVFETAGDGEGLAVYKLQPGEDDR